MFCTALVLFVHKWLAAFGVNLKWGFGPFRRNIFFERNLSWLLFLMAQAVTKLVTAI
jgi:hypothetical protein